VSIWSYFWDGPNAAASIAPHLNQKYIFTLVRPWWLSCLLVSSSSLLLLTQPSDYRRFHLCWFPCCDVKYQQCYRVCSSREISTFEIAVFTCAEQSLSGVPFLLLAVCLRPLTVLVQRWIWTRLCSSFIFAPFSWSVARHPGILSNKPLSMTTHGCQQWPFRLVQNLGSRHPVRSASIMFLNRARCTV